MKQQTFIAKIETPGDKIVGPYGEHVNTYDTIYLPLQRVIAAWDAEPEADA